MKQAPRRPGAGQAVGPQHTHSQRYEEGRGVPVISLLRSGRERDFDLGWKKATGPEKIPVMEGFPIGGQKDRDSCKCLEGLYGRLMGMEVGPDGGSGSFGCCSHSHGGVTTS